LYLETLQYNAKTVPEMRIVYLQGNYSTLILKIDGYFGFWKSFKKMV